MRLETLLKKLPYQRVAGKLAKEITGICEDSGKCTKGNVFVAISGSGKDGHGYLEEAVQNGATVCLVEKLPGISYDISRLETTVLLVADTRKALAHLANAFYAVDFQKMHLIGITGTKGKTSVAYMIYESLKEAGFTTGMIGSNGAFCKDWYRETGNTTPSALTIHSILSKMQEEGCRYVVMEISSQGVMHHRIEELPFEVGVFTNFAADHIGPKEHAAIEEYWFWKHQFMKKAKTCIAWEGIKKEKRKPCCMLPLTFGRAKDNYLQIEKEKRKKEEDGFSMEMTFCTEGKREKFTLPFPFHFQVMNAAAAVLTLKTLGIAAKAIRKAFRKLMIPGRCELVYGKDYRYIMIDYAHNAYSMEQVFQEWRNFSDLQIISLFGCGGGRSPKRRDEMGRISGMYADLTIVTEDNSRQESTHKIIEEIVRGVEAADGNYVVYKDRKDAIAFGLSQLKEHTLLLVLGKGRENYIEGPEGKIPYSDFDTIRRLQMEGGICG